MTLVCNNVHNILICNHFWQNIPIIIMYAIIFSKSDKNCFKNNYWCSVFITTDVQIKNKLCFIKKSISDINLLKKVLYESVGRVLSASYQSMRCMERQMRAQGLIRGNLPRGARGPRLETRWRKQKCAPTWWLCVFMSHNKSSVIPK